MIHVGRAGAWYLHTNRSRLLSCNSSVGNIYRPPKTTNGSLNVFIEELSYTLSSLENNNNQLILAGDFNINLLKLNDNEIYSNFFDTLVSQSLPADNTSHQIH